jgi:hypothetical protein
MQRPTEGTYLARARGSDEDSFALSVFENGGVRHHLIRKDAACWYVNDEPFGPLAGLKQVMEALAARYALVPRPKNAVLLTKFVPVPGEEPSEGAINASTPSQADSYLQVREGGGDSDDDFDL